jgi:hypothetical protein
MAGYVETLKDVCSKDLAADNAVVETTLNGMLLINNILLMRPPN